MNLGKLSPSMLIALGLMASCETGVCLSLGDDGPFGTETVGTSTGPGMMTTGSTGTSDSGGTSSGAMTGSSGSSGTGADTTIGPCLSPPEPSTGSDSGSDSGGSGSDSGGSSSGGMEAPPSETRAEALRRVLDGGKLPADVAARLRNRTHEH